MLNGATAGIGLVLALACDLRFAAESAVFTTAFARRGLIAEHGISWLLPRMVGPSQALDLLLSARRVLGGRSVADRPWSTGLPHRRADARALAYAVDLARLVLAHASLADDQASGLGGPVPDAGGGRRRRQSRDGGEPSKRAISARAWRISWRSGRRKFTGR